MSTPESRAQVTRRVGAPPERVFAAFASSDLVARWLSLGWRQLEVPVLVVDRDCLGDGDDN